jgi:hypothetical protein
MLAMARNTCVLEEIMTLYVHANSAFMRKINAPVELPNTGCLRREGYSNSNAPIGGCTHVEETPVLGPLDFQFYDSAGHLRTVLLQGRYSLPERDSPPQESQQPVVKFESSGGIQAGVEQVHSLPCRCQVA